MDMMEFITSTKMRSMTPEEHELIKRYLMKKSIPTGFNIFTMSTPCVTCSNAPHNGGGGVCHCTLGMTKIT